MPRKVKSEKRKKTPKSRKVKKSSKAGDVFAQLHGAVRPYLMANAAPFNDEAKGAHIPDEQARPSYKHCARARMYVNMMAAGRMVCFLFPTAVNNHGGMVSFRFADTALVAGATFDDSAAVGGFTYTETFLGTLPQSRQGFVETNSAGRAVSMSLKIRYVGPVSTRGGTAYWLESYNNAGLLRAGDGIQAWMDEMLANQQSRIVSLASASEHEFTVHPNLASNEWHSALGNTSFGKTDTPFWDLSGTDKATAELWGGLTSLPAPIGCLIIDTEATNSMPFILEVVQHAELCGSYYNPLVTPSPAAVEHCNLVNTSIEQAKINHNLEPDRHPGGVIVDTVKKHLKTTFATYSEKMIDSVLKPSNVTRLAEGMAGFFL